jgi:DNA-binding winged helix-turn-helix (wHTH) protein
MQITVKISGRNFFQRLSKEAKNPDPAFPKIYRSQLVEWKLEEIADEITYEELMCRADSPCVLLIEAENVRAVAQIHAVEKEAYAHMQANSSIPSIRAPIIFIYPSLESINGARDCPDFVCDWTVSTVAIPELARRVCFSLKRKNVFKIRIDRGALALIEESRSIYYGVQATRLTPTEYTLAELFLTHMGTVISLPELEYLFRVTGKSTETNNIRVAIFQLRLKLEILTKSQVQLTSVYKKGYCLSQKNSRVGTPCVAWTTAPAVSSMAPAGAV